MRLSNKIINTIALTLFTAAAVLTFSTCKPAIGTPWYPRSASSSSSDFFITGIQVKGIDVVPVLAETPTDDLDKLKKFSEANTYTVNVPPEVMEITAEDITVTAVTSLSKMEAITVEVTLNGGSIPLSAGRVVPATIKIADPAGNYAIQEKVLSITQSEPYDLNLTSLKLLDKELVENGTLQGTVTVPYTVASISAKDITASFTYGSYETVIPVELGKPSIKLYENEAVELTVSVKEQKGQYHAFECTLTVTREARPENADPALDPESIFILGALYEAGKALGVPVETERLTAADIVAVFKDFGDLPVTLSPNPAEFGSGDLMELKLSVPAQAGKYEGWETSITVKKDPTALNNPKDKNGNKKYIVKVNTITEEVSPFDYYTENYEFSASKFDEWVLVMPSMSGIIASYKFREGSWSGSPEMVDNIPSGIGSSFTAISNVKIYRYKTRKDRGSAHGTDSELATNPHDNRFYFYRFTADASMGIKADNSMFCVDRYSKFLFYYSEPAKIKWIAGNALPTEWTDYAAASIGDHIQFGEPFYMSDPVGYVKADGSVVMYQWIKDNINAANYHAQKNSAYTKKAGRSPGSAGYSPYRDKIITKRSEVENTVNSAYTVAVPVILGQPKAVRVQLNAEEDASFTVKTAPAPAGEALSYQWYKNTIQSNEGGAAISGATGATYTPDKSVETDCYVYCVVTNTNSENGATETAHSRAVKLLIREGSLAVDAEQPKVAVQPAGKIFSASAPEDERKMELKVTAFSLDKGKLSYQWYKNSTNDTSNGESIDGATEDSYSFTVGTTIGTEYYYCQITNTNNTVDGNKTASIFTSTAEVEVEESYRLVFKVNNDEAGRIVALRAGKPIELNSYVKKGDKIQFLAFCNPNYETQKWDAAVPTGNINMAEITITSEDDAKNTVCDMAYIPPGKLTVQAKKIKNLTLGDSNSAFTYDFRVGGVYDETQVPDFKSLWEKRGMKDLNIGEKGRNGEWIAKGTEKIAPAGASCISKLEYVRLNTKLVHYKTAYDISTYYLVKEKHILSDYQQSVVEFKYDRNTETWKCNTPNDFNISNVTVSYPADFALAQGETKDFIIKYDYSGKGAAEVTYTLKWE